MNLFWKLSLSAVLAPVAVFLIAGRPVRELLGFRPALAAKTEEKHHRSLRARLLEQRVLEAAFAAGHEARAAAR